MSAIFEFSSAKYTNEFIDQLKILEDDYDTTSLYCSKRTSKYVKSLSDESCAYSNNIDEAIPLLDLPKIKSATAYLKSLLHHRRYILILIAANFIGEDFNKSGKVELFQQIGFNYMFPPGSIAYIAFMNKGLLVCEKFDTGERYVHYGANLSPYNEMVMLVNSYGCYRCLLMKNNINYAKNDIGINILVLSAKEYKILDAVAIDSGKCDAIYR